MKKDNVTLKSYFETGDYPTEAQFIDLIDSFLNIDEEDAVTGISDNGDDTYTFQLLSGGSITINGAGIPNEIPIANIIGLQNTLDSFVDLSNNQTVAGEKIWSDSHQFNGRIGIGNFPFGPNRLGDAEFQASSIDTKAINWKDDAQGTIAAIFTNPSGTVMTIKGFDDSIMVADFTSKAGIEGTDPHESTIANTIEHTNGVIFINDQGVQSYPGATTPVANAFFQVLQNRGGGARKPYWFGYYDGTTYETIWEVNTNGVVTFNQVTKGKEGVGPEDFVTKAQLDAMVSSGNFIRNDQDETTTGAIQIDLNSLAQGDLKSFGIGLLGNSAYYSMNTNGWTVLGNSSANDGSNTFLIIKRNGDFEISDNGTVHTIWHSGNDASLLPVSAVEIPGSQNLNNYQTAGFYYQTANVDAASGSNYPEPLAGSLFVQKSAGGVAQQYQTYNDGSPELWFRALYNSSWSTWRKVLNNSGPYSSTAVSSRDKIRVWSGAPYNIGMEDAVTFGGLGDFAMTFQMNSDNNRGFWWGDSGHSKAQGAMALTTQGYLTLANHMRVGYGESDTVAVSTTYTIQANGTMQATNFILSSDERLKENIEDLDIQSVTVKWKKFKFKNKDETRFGVIAQELEENHPEFVITDEEGFKSVSYIDLLVVKNAELEERIEKLESLVKKLI